MSVLYFCRTYYSIQAYHLLYCTTNPKYEFFCCITTIFCKETKSLAFNRCRCCLPALCLRLIPYISVNQCFFAVQVSYVLIVQPPEEKDKTDGAGMNVYDFDADGDVDFVDSDGDDDDKAKMKPPAKRSQMVKNAHPTVSFQMWERQVTLNQRCHNNKYIVSIHNVTTHNRLNCETQCNIISL